MNTRTLIPLTAALFLMAACGGAAAPTAAPPRPTSAPAATQAPQPVPAPAATAAPGVGSSGIRDSVITGGKLAAPVDPLSRMVIRNASMTLLVEDTQHTLNDIGALLDRLGGYTQSASTSKPDGFLNAEVVIKVPGNKLGEAMEALRKMALDVQQENASGDDVTAEYADLDARTRNLELAEKQLQGLLAKQDKTDDIISLFNKLTDVRGQIEQAKGRMAQLSRLSDMATINLRLVPRRPTPTPTPTATPYVWKPGETMKAATDSLNRSLEGLANTAIWFGVGTLPVLLMALAPIILFAAIVIRAVRKAEQKQNKAAAEQK
ncbi:MAG TPA: DUF4349 domain-containing protein [Thermoflexales bacterium]|mgnify:FL=1|nr:DUF4349 domain-containing protein [Thermoflexales bacterium]HQW34200.1 DUF4349 domain-containing protein [Thermoflexales bacterium]HQZ20852.1 DUF4349 domain-containing protein [Thermoflexales bacterium]